MQRVIVTVKRQREARGRDLEVPAEVKAEPLAKMIAKALRWENDPAVHPIEYEIMAEPLGRILNSHESLAEAGVWDGVTLVFQPPGDDSLHLPPEPISDAQGPLKGWQPLEIDPQAAPQPGQEKSSPEEPGFVWKQLD